MRTGILLPTTVPGMTGEQIVAWARSAEEKGFDSLGVIDATAHDGHDSLVALSMAAAVTERIELVANVLIGPLCNAEMLARQATSLDRASGGRLTLAVGVREDQVAGEGIDPWQRGRLLDGHLAHLAGKAVVLSGEARQVARRIATRGQGWLPPLGTPDQLAAGVIALHHAWACAGRPGHPRSIAVLALDSVALTSDARTSDAVRTGLHGFGQAGADDVLIAMRSADLGQLDLIADVALTAPALA
jgi:alkanesulfonate monooxygenase SsuD/methylene tetrahydromethanopterin reductase-like flavin-dependent oxidoreductase (luciferase family)